MKSPFQYGTLVDKESFVNRVEDRRQLKDFLSAGINVMLISPRRWGKSSLVKVAMNELTEENKRMRICFIDAFSVKTEAEFLQSFAREVISCASSTWEKRLEDVKHFLTGVTPSITIKDNMSETLSLDLKLGFEERQVMDILALPERIAEAKKIHIIVCIDEFQQLALLPSYQSLEGKMRSVWQTQQRVSYCFYGSKRHMMLDIFNKASNPFYRFGQVLFMQKIAKEEWIPFIVHSFRKTGKEITEEQAGYICETVKCHSWYVQQYSFFVWTATSTSVSDEILKRQLCMLIDTNMPMFMSDTENLTASQVAMLRAITDGKSQLNAEAVVTKYGLGNPQTITRNKRILIERDFVEKQEDAFAFTDPIFEIWFREQYM
ncbi:AAA family ATPase [Bacteroides sp. UBA939]|uniref:AAA family ATPase n=1 Tax=Bacteroides sp. UBA939 TaxID=1946092 RepID=UPI0025BACAEE|nr:ATP-binding protein [Bacteroides sp. UBA939]